MQDIDIALIRGAYTIDSITLDKINDKVPVPFFVAKTIDISVEWDALNCRETCCRAHVHTTLSMG